MSGIDGLREEVAAFASGVPSREELLACGIPSALVELVPPGTTRVGVVALVTWWGAMGGDRTIYPLLMERLYPRQERVEDASMASTPEVAAEALARALGFLRPDSEVLPESTEKSTGADA